MRKLLFLLMFTFCFSPEIFADFFKWEIQLAVKGFGKEIETFPVATEGKIQFSDIKIECRMESFWTPNTTNSKSVIRPQEMVSGLNLNPE